MNDQELSSLLQTSATRFKASERLRAAVVTQIALQSVARNKRRRFVERLSGWLQMAGLGDYRLWVSFATGVVLTVAIGLALPHFQSPGMSDQDVVSFHIRAMGDGPLFAVASNDRHTVKPWFQGKLDYAPEVVDLSEDGFPLLGGRVDRVKGQPTAALVYSLRKHYINAFQRPSELHQEPRRSEQRGFSVIQWSDGRMAIWLVSDGEAGELERFVRAWRSKTEMK